MTIYRLVLALLGALLLSLVGVNMALALRQESSEIRQGLSMQAEAASKTTARFLRARAEQGLPLVDGRIADRVRHAGPLVPDLVQLAVVEGGRVTVLFGPQLSPDLRQAAPAGEPQLRDVAGRSLMISTAPVARGSYVVAAVNASALGAAVDTLLGLFGRIALAVAVVVALLAFAITRPIVRQLFAVGRLFANPHKAAESDADFTISEVASLRDAAVLMQASRIEAAERADKEIAARAQDDDLALVERASQSYFAPVTVVATTAMGSARLLGRAEPGTFFALVQAGDGEILAATGVCSGDNAVEALGRAVAARRFVEANPMLAPDHLASELESVFHARQVQVVHTSAIHTDAVLTALGDPADSALISQFAASRSGISACQLLDEIDRIVSPSGAIAVVIRQR